MATQNNLKDPEFVRALRADVSNEAAPAFQFLLNHARAIATVVVVLILVVAGLAGWKWHARKALDAARSAVGAALVAKEGQDKLAALDALAEESPEQLRTAIFLDSALAAMDMKDAGKAAQYWQRAAASLTGPMRTVALLAQANALDAAGNPEQALRVLEPLSVSAEKALLPVVHQQWASVAEKAGNFEQAEKAYALLLAETEAPADQAFYTSRLRHVREARQKEPAVSQPGS